jgi:hypothetical protein
MPVCRAGIAHEHAHQPRWRKWFKRFISATTVASIVVLTEPFWGPLEDQATVLALPQELMHDRWGTLPRGLEKVGIVKIDEEHYSSAYNGKSPLNRCAMASDLERLARVPHIDTIAVDFDLSPIAADSSDDCCQAKLDRVITAHAKRLILMNPAIPDDDPALAAKIRKWVDNLPSCVKLGDVAVSEKRGWVREYRPVTGAVPSFGLLLDARMRGEPSRSIHAEQIGSSNRSIAFKSLAKFFGNGRDLKLSDTCLNDKDRPPECAQLRTLIFGSGYGLDQFTTPYGKLDGVDIHAAIAACPAAGVSHATLFVLEILLGMFVLAPLFECGWKRYFETASGKADRHARRQALLWQKRSAFKRCLAACVPTQPQAAYAWIGLIALGGVFILGVIVLASALWFSREECPLLLFPFGFVVGMFIDAAITTNTEVAAEEVTTLQSEASRLGPVDATDFKAQPLVGMHCVIKVVLYVALLAAAIAKLRHYF